MAKKIAAKQVEGLVEGLGKAVITSIAITGTNTKTLTITFSDNSTKSTTFTDLNDNITYAAMTAADLTNGTDTTNKVIAAKVFVDYINTRLGSVMTYKGQKNTWADLPTINNKVGDVWNVMQASKPNNLKAGDNVAWDGTGWDILSGFIDISEVETKIKTDAFVTASTHLTNLTTAVYTLSYTPKNITSVTMNGVKQPLASYVNSATTLTITQSKLPVPIEVTDEIEVTYNY